MRQAMTGPMAPGDTVEVTVGEAVHGGWCVSRSNAGPVVFVRHALPGERVRAIITQTTTRFARADAVEILAAAPGRVSAPCPYARPGGCGGCDWQHASLPTQREIKAKVIRQQLTRIAGLDEASAAVTVEPLRPDDGGLGWRTRVRFAVGLDGRAGLYRHRSHEIEPIRDCLIAHPLVNEAAVTRREWPGARWVDVAVAPGRALGPGADPDLPGQPQDPDADRVVMVSGRRVPEPRYLTHQAAGRDWRVNAAGFWQVHPGAADALADAVMTALRPAAGETALDLFCGAGLFAGVLATAVGPDGRVIAVERDARAAADARHNLRALPWVRVYRGDAAHVLRRHGLGRASVAVLDPPRSGAKSALIDTLCAGRRIRRIGYVSCDPATLARDIAVFARHGWRLDSLRAFDVFPMTHHVECLAVLVPRTR